MKKWVVNVEETLIKSVEVEAETPYEAEQKVRDAYHHECIILTADDYINTDFDCLAEQDGSYQVDMKL